MAVSMALHAQVTMGSFIAPPEGALLNLQEYGSCSQNTTSTKGLLLPRVGLTSLSSLEDIEGVNSNTPKRYSGLMVYNVNNFNNDCLKLPIGLYVWSGSSWENVEGKETSEMPGSYTEDVFVLKRIMAENKNARLGWLFDESDPANPKYIEGSGTGVYFTQNSCGQLRLTKLEIANQASLLTLDVSGATALEELECYRNSSLASLKISNNPELSVLRCRENSALQSLSLKDASSLEIASCYNNPALRSLDASHLKMLTQLRCYNNPSLVQLNIQGADNLSYLDCWSTSIVHLDVSDATCLTFLRCDTKTLDNIQVIIDESQKNIELIPDKGSNIYNWI